MGFQVQRWAKPGREPTLCWEMQTMGWEEAERRGAGQEEGEGEEEKGEDVASDQGISEPGTWSSARLGEGSTHRAKTITTESLPGGATRPGLRSCLRGPAV